MAQASEPEPGRDLTRCPMHGISYDAEKEACPECAKPRPRAPAVAVEESEAKEARDPPGPRQARAQAAGRRPPVGRPDDAGGA